MKTTSMIQATAIGLAFSCAPLLAQSEGGNTGPQGAGGTSGNAGTATSSAQFGQRGTNGGKSTTTGSTPSAPATNAPSDASQSPPPEYHPAQSASHPDDQRTARP